MDDGAEQGLVGGAPGGAAAGGGGRRGGRSRRLRRGGLRCGGRRSGRGRPPSRGNGPSRERPPVGPEDDLSFGPLPRERGLPRAPLPLLLELLLASKGRGGGDRVAKLVVVEPSPLSRRLCRRGSSGSGGGRVLLPEPALPLPPRVDAPALLPVGGASLGVRGSPKLQRAAPAGEPPPRSLEGIADVVEAGGPVGRGLPPPRRVAPRLLLGARGGLGGSLRGLLRPARGRNGRLDGRPSGRPEVVLPLALGDQPLDLLLGRELSERGLERAGEARGDRVDQGQRGVRGERGLDALFAPVLSSSVVPLVASPRRRGGRRLLLPAVPPRAAAPPRGLLLRGRSLSGSGRRLCPPERGALLPQRLCKLARDAGLSGRGLAEVLTPVEACGLGRERPGR